MNRSRVGGQGPAVSESTLKNNGLGTQKAPRIQERKEIPAYFGLLFGDQPSRADAGEAIMGHIRHKTVEETMNKIPRRNFLKITTASAAATKLAGIAGILASGRAPAYAQAQSVHWLRWADFVPASDVLLKGEITQECQKALGMKLEVETINANLGCENTFFLARIRRRCQKFSPRLSGQASGRRIWSSYACTTRRR